MNYSKIGQSLKSAREKKGLSLHQVFEVTRIQPGILKDIETGQFKKSEVFLKNFIKTYSESLGLNFKKLIESGNDKGDQAVEALDEADKLELKFFKENKSAFKIVLFSAICLFVVFLCFEFTSFFRKKDSLSSAETEILSPIVEEKADQTNAIGGKEEIPEEPVEDSFSSDQDLWTKLRQSSFNHEVMIQSSDSLKLYFKVDESSILTKELEPWKWFVIKARKFIYIRMDNPKMTAKIFYNGQGLEVDSLSFFERSFQ